jgi:molecular chaperone GrpE
MNEPDTEPNKDAGGAPEAPSAADAHESRLEDAERRAAENWDKYLRASAELENVRRRVERESATLQKYALERILGELITVNDSFELGMKAIADESEETRKHLEGLALTHKQFWGALERHGVSQVDPQGQPFNPELHEAVSMVESAQVPPNHVLTVMQKGYRLHDRVLRPAMVVVARAPATEGGPQGA